MMTGFIFEYGCKNDNIEILGDVLRTSFFVGLHGLYIGNLPVKHVIRFECPSMLRLLADNSVSHP